jgi:membrane protease YdiL (CAAX protease family)
MAYEMHEYLVAPARKKPQAWRLVVGLILAAAIYVFLLFVLFAALATFGLDTAETLFAARTPSAVIVLLASFACMTAGAWLAAKTLQKRSFTSLLGPLPLAVTDFWSVLKVCSVLVFASLLLPAPMGIEIIPNVPFATWAPLLILSLPMLFIQVSAEEIVFRGYFQSQLAARFKSPLIWLLVPAIVFGVAHYDPASMGANAAIITLWAVFYGVMLGDITARAGNLGPAIALHLLNNFLAIMIVSAQGDLSGLALYVYPFDLQDTELLRAMMPIELALMVVFWLGARLAIKR